MARMSTLASGKRRRLARVTLPDSRALKWSCPERFRINLPDLPILNRLNAALWVFSLGINKSFLAGSFLAF